MPKRESELAAVVSEDAIVRMYTVETSRFLAKARAQIRNMTPALRTLFANAEHAVTAVRQEVEQHYHHERKWWTDKDR